MGSGAHSAARAWRLTQPSWFEFYVGIGGRAFRRDELLRLFDHRKDATRRPLSAAQTPGWEAEWIRCLVKTRRAAA